VHHAGVAPRICPTRHAPVPRGAAAGTVVRVPLSWYNPFSWNWGHVLGKIWNAVWNNCLSGAAQGIVGTASGTLAVNLIARGAKVVVGPSGYAVIAIGDAW
jgi:hypothetical protein